MSGKPHPKCPNHLEEFSLEIGGNPCRTRVVLGQNPLVACIGGAHPRRLGTLFISYSYFLYCEFHIMVF